MRPHRPGIVGTALAALAVAGCGEDPGIEQGLVPFKETSTQPYTSQIIEMKKVVKDQAYMKKREGVGKSAADPGPAADFGPAADIKTATKGR